MSTNENKKRTQVAFDALSEGDAEPFLGLLADDVNWTILGSTAWSRTYQGKAAVMEDLLAPVFAKFATQLRITASRLVAEDDIVVVEARGDVTTTSGDRYDNTYCFVCRFDDGRICEITEYMDTDLVRQVLGER
ncbi:MAG: nuclear transport factor 2 family protein [Acidimicrobiia bacterium]